MPYHPDIEEQIPYRAPGGLVLPAQPDSPGVNGTSDIQGRLPASRSSTGQFNELIPPAHLLRPTRSSAPKGVLARLAYYWRKDPAYKVFMLAIVMVVLASIVFVSMASAALFGKPSTGSSYTQTPPTVTAPSGTVDLRPTFAAPGGGKGSGQSSQPPAQSTPVLGSTPTASVSPSPTQPGQGGPLSLQITNYPTFILNNSNVEITVTANQPGVNVYLIMQSNATPRTSRYGPGTTDANGNATIDWPVFYTSFGKRTVTVNITAFAFDQNGQRIDSSPVTVQVLLQEIP
jgi:hypothetical protein